MIVERNLNSNLKVEELQLKDLGSLAGLFLNRPSGLCIDDVSFNAGLIKLFNHLNIQHNFDENIQETQYFKLTRDNWQMGFVALSDIVEAHRAKLQLKLYQDHDFTSEEIEKFVELMLAKIKQGYDLKWLEINIHNDINPLESMLLKQYKSYRIGFVNLNNASSKYVVSLNNESNFYKE
ncbi:hypothetical protein SAMN05444483_104167 [Salegentibacter echinorum]|uniref:Uncharacterized protein n=1 Tax=Salegentibacter echinorum TaxID=1073325 RepID=A0A1M5GHG2_SALEC|nr:hypothetical protein [Salegentibacter echinorum]SHG03210.1 hypothetical protein SAMN05444483_104167 [Salegentibacter echinorum]